MLTQSTYCIAPPLSLARIFWFFAGTVAPGESFASPHSLDYDDVTSTVVVADRNNNRVVLLDGMKGGILWSVFIIW